MSKAKQDLSTLIITLVAGAALAAGSFYVAGLGTGGERQIAQSVGQLRWIILLMAIIVLAVAMFLSRRLSELAAHTELQQRFPPEVGNVLPADMAEPCSGEDALMVAATLRGYALLLTCVGIGALLAGLLFARGV
jgi:hypothetical protein